MTAKTLFNIILKVLGIFFIKDFLEIIPQLLAPIMYWTAPGQSADAIWTLLSTLVILCAYGVTSYYLIFRTEWVIDKLKLDKGIDREAIPLNIHRSTVLSISIIVIGGLLVVEEIPNFCRLLYSYFQEQRMSHGMTHPNIAYSIASGIKIVIGLSLMSSQRRIVSWIEGIRRKQ